MLLLMTWCNPKHFPGCKRYHVKKALHWITSLAIVFAGWCHQGKHSIECWKVSDKLEKSLEALDQRSPGTGIIPGRQEVAGDARAYAMIGSLHVMRSNIKDARIAADWLVMNRIKSPGPGWGLPFSWDAFGDGTLNDINTIYGITVAQAVKALLDVCEITDTPIYCVVAQEKLDYYKKFYTDTNDGGYFWYSDQHHDAKDVHNVNAMLMAQYARAANLFMRKDYGVLADRTFKHIWAKRHDDGLGTWWFYGSHKSIPNDLVHAAMMVDGISDYKQYTGTDIDMQGMLTHLRTFIQDNRIREFPPHPDLSEELNNRPARVWGLGALIGILSKHGYIHESARLIRALDSYAFASGRYGLVPGDRNLSPILQSYVATGLQQYLSRHASLCVH